MCYYLIKNKNKGNKMRKDFAIERRGEILQLINRKGRITVGELIKKFGASGATIRRDLESLERQDLIKRAHGGALSKSRVSFEPDYFEEKEKFTTEKEKIGKEASKLIEEGEVIFLEASTTVLHLARNIRERKDLTIITNSLDIARELDKRGINLILTGGILRRRTRALIGPLAGISLSQIRVDKAFVGISAIELSQGITAPTLEEAQTKRKISEVAHKVIALTDHSKFGKRNFASVAPINSISILITDKEIPEKIKKEIEKMGVEVRTA